MLFLYMNIFKCIFSHPYNIHRNIIIITIYTKKLYMNIYELFLPKKYILLQALSTLNWLIHP